jgi:GT2 family glycosyltransferase
MPRVAAVIVTWNSLSRLPEALASIAAQTHPDIQTIVVDNGSSDGTADFVRAKHPAMMLLRNSKNLGAARARNQAIAYAATHLRRDADLFLLFLSPDTVLGPQFVASLLEQIERRPEVGSAGGKIVRLRLDGDDGLTVGERTGVIDSAGLVMSRSRTARKRGAGEQDDGSRYGRTEEVFGFSASSALYRLEALESVAVNGEYFDEDFFQELDDVDMAWRLRRAGWQALYVSGTEAGRYGMSDDVTDRRVPASTRFLTYRNRLVLRFKNDRIWDSLLALPWIWASETRAFLSALFQSPRSLRALPAALGLLPRAWRKRRFILKNARVPGREMRKWFV